MVHQSVCGGLTEMRHQVLACLYRQALVVFIESEKRLFYRELHMRLGKTNAHLNRYISCSYLGPTQSCN